MIWHDASELTFEGRGWTDTEAFYDRLPARAKSAVPDNVWHLSHHTAGMNVRFVTDGPFEIEWAPLHAELAMSHMPSTGVSGVDVYRRQERGKWRYLATGRPESLLNRLSLPDPKGCWEYLVNLPLYNGVKWLRIGVAAGQKLQPGRPRPHGAKPIVFYGTSITQGGCVSRPGMVFTSIVGRTLDTEVVNLGFSGGGRSELEVIGFLAELDPAVFVLDAAWNMTAELIDERIVPGVRILRKARPNTPVLLCEDVRNPGSGLSDRSVRMEAAYKQLLKQRVKHLHYLPGKGILGPDDEGTVDGCHTTDLGQWRQARAFVKALRPILQGRQRPARRRSKM